MDEFHARLARIGLAAAGPYGFCLAGGYAIQAHGFVQRQSEDVDLFTTMTAVEGAFSVAVEAVAEALRSDGLEVTTDLQFETFARLGITDQGTGRNSKMELGVDWRAHPPARIDIGPVLHVDDAVANKLCALFGRGEVRDYIDVDAIIGSGRYETSELVALAANHDPGFDVTMFADALRAVRRHEDEEFAAYGLTPEQVRAMRGRLVASAESFDSARQGVPRPTDGLGRGYDR